MTEASKKQNTPKNRSGETSDSFEGKLKHLMKKDVVEIEVTQVQGLKAGKSVRVSYNFLGCSITTDEAVCDATGSAGLKSVRSFPVCQGHPLAEMFANFDPLTAQVRRHMRASQPRVSA